MVDAATQNEVLSSIAQTGIISTPWPELREALKIKLEENLSKLQPPVAGSHEEDIKEVEFLGKKIHDALDSFVEDAPFTIQRLAELAIRPSGNYTSQTKYLRAIQRTLHVSSGTSNYVTDTYALSPGPAESSILGHVSTLSSNSTTPLLRSSISPTASPLLSPIPWIGASSSPTDPESMQLDGPSSSPHATPVNGHDASLAEGGSPSIPTASPTGGRVDELDPLPPSLTSAPQPTGMAESPSPITEPQGSPPRSQLSPDLAGSPPRGGSPRRTSF